jgi:RimJ/RimL family protein N-acetyltransferase
MRRLVTNDKERVNQWIYKRIGRASPFAPANTYNAVGVEDENGNLIAAVAFDSFSPEVRCSMHCAGEADNWCSKRLLKFCFDYVFNIAKCKVVINIVSSTNQKSIDFTKHVGFTEFGRIKDGAEDGDLVVLTLHRDQCRWIRG